MCIRDRHGGELPGEVVCVLDTGVGTERPGGGHLVGRVAGEEDPAGRVPFGDPLRGVPRRLAGDLNRHVRYARCPADVVDAPLVGEVLQGLAPVGVPGGVEDPVRLVVHRQQGAVGLGVGQVAGDEAAVAHDLSELRRAEGDAHVVEQVAGPGLPEAQPLPDRAAGAVGRDEVVRVHDGELAGLPVPEGRPHPLRVLLERAQLGGEAQVTTLFAGTAHQYRFEVVLAAQTPGGRADTGQPAARVDLLEQPLLVVAGERRCLEDPVVVGQGRGGLADRLLRPGHPEQLHRADVVPPAARVAGGVRMLLDQ